MTIRPVFPLFGLRVFSAGLLLGIANAAPEPAPAPAAEPPLPAVQVLVPGFAVRPLPVQLTNLVSIEYAPDGRLFAAGYDGRLHLLRDADGDGLEETVTTFWDQTSADYPLGLVVRDEGVYVLLKNELVRFVDTDQDGVPDRHETVIKDWDDPKLEAHPLLNHRRVDYGMGLAVGPDGAIYIGVGNAAYNNAYMLDKKGKLGEKDLPYYDRHNLRGCVLKFSPDGKSKEQLVTGTRYLMCMQFNRHGDLFAADQEGATWLPNGNPFDELLHLQAGRHYGFPPRHPQYLPDVIDEPSVFDYAPQHQSLCGFRFNGESDASAVFGPAWWRGDALLTGFTRGKLYRTKLVKTDAGYVAQNHLIAQLQSMAADLSVSPQGDLVVASHSGKPDWGTGPKGEGLLHKLTFQRGSETGRSERPAGTSPGAAPPRVEPSLPVAAWSAGPGEFRIAFDHPLDPGRLKSLAAQMRIVAGKSVYAGDRFETLRPGYEVVQQQMTIPRFDVPVLAAGLAPDARTLIVNTPADTTAWNYALTLPGIGRTPAAAGEIEQQSAIDLQTDRYGVAARWQADTSDETWTGWLPHADLAVVAALTRGSSEHERFAALLKQPGTLTLRGQWDLWQMLQPAVQPISELDYERPVESVTVVVTAARSFRMKSESDGASTPVERTSAPADGEHGVTLTAVGRENQWLTWELTLPTGGQDAGLSVSWFTDTDSRPRAFPLRRFLLPWARPPAGTSPPPVDRSQMPELAGGDIERGRQLFVGNVANCGKCHQVRGEGAKIGPDLSNLVHRDYDSVLRDIREPSAAINPDYLNYIVVLTDGRILQGIVHQDSANAITLADNTGKLIELQRTEIESITPSGTSVMPQDVTKQLSPAQVRDLLTFLLLDPAQSRSP